MNVDQEISEVIENFDFNKVKIVMRALDWRWGENYREPTYIELIKEATLRLKDAVNQLKDSNGEDIYFSASGGFKAQAYYQTMEELCLTLEFIITESQNF